MDWKPVSSPGPSDTQNATFGLVVCVCVLCVCVCMCVCVCVCDGNRKMDAEAQLPPLFFGFVNFMKVWFKLFV